MKQIKKKIIFAKKSTMKILIAGCGNMGLNYAQSLLKAKLVIKESIYIIEKSEQRREELKKREFNNVYECAGDFVIKADVVILSVKPQDWTELASALTPYCEDDQVFVSIMAGLSIKALQKSLNKLKVIRAMPNLPSQVGLGMTAYTSAEEVTRGELMFAQNLLSSTGKTLYLKDESMIDPATALSGSGPAYIYYFMNAMIEAGMEMGFTYSESEIMVNQTFMGSIHLHHQENISCQDWISRVASKGGTTEAALNSFNSDNIDNRIKNGLKTAFNRAVELGK